MKAQQAWVMAVGLALIGGGGAALLRLKAHQKLGNPGVKLEGPGADGRMFIPIPETVSGWQSSNLPPTSIELKTLPEDTTISKRVYRAQDGFQALMTVVLMGKDRTSIHKPEYCLTAQGWSIVGQSIESVRVGGARPYALPLRCFTTSAQFQDSTGRPVRQSGVFVFWFVAEDRLTVSHWSRVRWITWELLRRGVLPRWAYVTCFAPCPPGREAAALERMKGLLAAAVPEFQITTPRDGLAAAGR
jgi:hypothetical protein